MNARAKRIALLVAERDSDWGDWVDYLRGQADDIAIVLQRMGESAGELATRVRRRVGDLQREGEIVAAALIGADRWDSETLSARALMVQAVVSQMDPSESGRLYLDGGPHYGRGRHAMMALASVVQDQIPAGVDVLTTTPADAARRHAA